MFILRITLKNANKRKLQQIGFNHSSDIDLRDMHVYKKCIAKLYSFLVIDATLALDDPSRFRKNLLERIKKIIMTTDKIIYEKLQYDINREAAKISTLSSGKIDKYECLTGEKILPSDQTRVIEQANFTITF